MIKIDGSKGEGGGQVLRSALTLSLLTEQPFKLNGIRAKRSKPGLHPQHLKAVEAAAEVGGAQVTGAAIDSMALQFEPGQVQTGHYDFDIGTAGAVSLLLQTVYLPLAMADGPSSITIRGGTHVPLSPCFHYLDLHWRQFLARIGLQLSLEMERTGFYPPGGIIHAAIQPTRELKPLCLTKRGRLLQINGLSATANLPAHVSHRQRDQCLRRLGEAGYGESCMIATKELPAASKGTVLLLLAEFEHIQACFFALGERGKPAEHVADEAVDELLAYLGTDGTVEHYLADQLLLPLALAKGESILHTSHITRHLLTNAEIIRTFLPVVLRIDGKEAEPGIVHIRPQSPR